jgi:hypothetical protein
VSRANPEREGDQGCEQRESSDPGCFVELVQAAGGGKVAAGLAGGSDSSRNAKLICMRALDVRRRLNVPASESVDQLAELEQIIETTEG